MAYTKKFQHLADIAMAEAVGVSPEQVNDLLAQGAVALWYSPNLLDTFHSAL